MIAQLPSLIDAHDPAYTTALANEGFHIGIVPGGQRYYNWAPGHPLGADYDCVVIKADGLWYSTQCGMHSAVCICSIVVDNYPPPAPPPPSPSLPPAAPIGTIVVAAVAAFLVVAVALVGCVLFKKKMTAVHKTPLVNAIPVRKAS